MQIPGLPRSTSLMFQDSYLLQGYSQLAMNLQAGLKRVSGVGHCRAQCSGFRSRRQVPRGQSFVGFADEAFAYDSQARAHAPTDCSFYTRSPKPRVQRLQRLSAPKPKLYVHIQSMMKRMVIPWAHESTNRNAKIYLSCGPDPAL